MTVPRRFLPSISSLLAIEAVERLGTATAAADELSLTHSAVSRQLKVLEEQIGVTMFRREGKGLALTLAGVEYARAVRGVLDDLARASLRIKASGECPAVNLAILPAFGMFWLSPRLQEFSRAHPKITVNLATRLLSFDFNRDKHDAAIHYGRRDWRGVNYLELASERIIPACAPSFVTAGQQSVQALLSLPLLHLESRPGAWEAWFTQQGCSPGNLSGILFDQFMNMAEAATLGFGVALLPEFLAEKEFARGRLVRAWPDYTQVDGRYYLVWPQDREPSRALQTLVKWLEKEASAPPRPHQPGKAGRDLSG